VSGGAPVVLATAQPRVTADVSRNGSHIRALIREAKLAGCHLLHLSEGALSGYVRRQIRSWEQVNWDSVTDEMGSIQELAAELELWVVLGCNHRLDRLRPHNSLYVISNCGKVLARYDKRICSHSELNAWYTPGESPCVFEVQGLRFGCALCIEVNFPELFSEYERLGVDCVLLSSYSRNPMFGTLAQAHAASNCYWLSLSIPAEMSRGSGIASRFVGPTGEVLATCRKGSATLTVNSLDPSDARWDVPLRRARPWRARARALRKRTPED
jgi:predicted amidohydrolase